MSENHSDLSELKSVFNPLFSAKIRVLFLRLSNLIIRQFIGPITYIRESTLADAIMDRLSGNALRFDLKGESLRRKKLEKND